MRRRLAPLLAVIALVASTGLACSPSGGGGKQPLAGPDQPLRWAAGQAERADGQPPSFTAAGVCGSDHATYLAELLHTPPTHLKVLDEWADIVPGGKQILAAGSVASTHLGPTDLPLDHVWGDDLSMDVAVDPAFRTFARSLGPPEAPPGEQHVEISSGLIPHEIRPAQQATTWRQQSDRNLPGFQPGFDHPAVGDRALVMGRWIIDCGHDNYGTELHPLSFVAWTKRTGTATVARAYLNPYRDSERYSPDQSLLGKVDDPSRFTRPDTKPFPPYFIDEVVRVATGKEDRLHSRELIEAPQTSPVEWQVCAPAGTHGHRLDVRYDVVTRPGMQVSVRPDGSDACATVHVSYGPGYHPADPAVRQCLLPWTQLSSIASAALHTKLDVLGLVDKYVPPPVQPKVNQDPDTTCADALAGPSVSPTPGGQQVRVDPDQPVPFYGVITAALVD